MELFGIYILLINLGTFFLFAADKWKAVHHRWRIQESVLIGFSALGGAFGGLLAMRLFRHKTKKPKFSIGVPMLLLLWLLLLFWIGTQT